MTFVVLMATFIGAFAVIERVLPTLYRRQIVAEYDELMVELQHELVMELQNELIVIIPTMPSYHNYDRTELFDQIEWYEQNCIAIDDLAEIGVWWSPESLFTHQQTADEEADECYEIFVEVTTFVDRFFNWYAPQFTYQIEWFNLRQMRDHHESHGSNAYLIARQIIEDFAMTNNVRVIVWEIWGGTELVMLGDILFEFEGRSAELDFMTAMGDTEAAVRQQNFFSNNTGGFAIAISGTFQPAYRVLNIISELQRQIMLIMAVISFGIALFFAIYLVRPIVKVTKQSQELRELNFDKELRLNRRDELGDLSSNLNYMSYKLKNALDELQDANAKLKDEMAREREQERQRRNMFTSISHELKTPITILKGEIGGMIDGVGDYQDRDTYLASTYGWVENLEKLVGEILTITRLEGEQMQLNLQPIDMAEMLLAVIKTHQSLADKQDVNVLVTLNENLVTQADETQLQLAFSNIVNNAIFYTPAGKHVEVSLRQVGDHVVVQITNAGVSIPEEALQQIFNPFYRVDKSRNRHTGGSGLGLFIVKNILELHGFEYAINNIDTGVCFTIKMPMVMGSVPKCN